MWECIFYTNMKAEDVGGMIIVLVERHSRIIVHFSIKK